MQAERIYCDKCKSVMEVGSFASTGVGSEGYDDLCGSVVQGASCRICGSWKELDLKPAMDFDFKKGRLVTEEVQKKVSMNRAIARFNEYDEAVWKLREKLRNGRRMGMTTVDAVRLVMNKYPAFSEHQKRVKSAVDRLYSGRLAEVINAIGKRS